MADIVLDATILIDASNNHPRALRYVDDLLATQAAVSHAQAMAEVLTVTRNSRELLKLQRFMRRFRILHANEADSQSALHFLARFHLSHDLDFGDCLIGSTALRLNFPVATLNVRHFRLFPGLKVIQPY